MRIYQPKYKQEGQTKTVKKWWCEVVDSREKGFRKVRRFALCDSESQSKKLGGKIKELIDYAALDTPNPLLIQWFADYAPAKLRDKLIETALLPARTKEANRPLVDYLPEFAKTILGRKDRTKNDYAATVTKRVRRIIIACKFKTWRDVSGSKVDGYIDRLPIGRQTAHFYIQSFRRFCKWMVDEDYADRAPRIHSVTVPKNYGRAFELDDFKRLLESTRAGKARHGMTGYQRYILYILACETGLRRSELRSVTPAAIDFNNSCVFVRGNDTKNGNEAAQHFTPGTGQLLQDFIKGKMPTVQLFPIIEKSSRMIHADCRDAGIEIENHRGRLNFHSLRHTTGSYLAAQGVHPKAIQEIMRHSDINLTMSRYTHLLSGAKQAAVNMMPDFTKSQQKKKKA